MKLNWNFFFLSFVFSLSPFESCTLELGSYFQIKVLEENMKFLSSFMLRKKVACLSYRALALAPLVDRGLSWFTLKFKFESRGKVS